MSCIAESQASTVTSPTDSFSSNEQPSPTTVETLFDASDDAVACSENDTCPEDHTCPEDCTCWYCGTERDVDGTFSWRQLATQQDETIHHFNWKGEAVYKRSATTPEESLTAILARPKLAAQKENYRVQAILNRAYQYVDPVVVNREEHDEAMLHMKGSSLANWAAGRAQIMYTPHGTWAEDDDRCSIRDEGDISSYEDPTLAVGNGFVDNDDIPTYAQWLESQQVSVGPRTLPRRLSWKPSHSQLSLSPTINTAPSPEERVSIDLPEEQTGSPVCPSVAAKKKRSRKRDKVKAAVRKTLKASLSVFKYLCVLPPSDDAQYIITPF